MSNMKRNSARQRDDMMVASTSGGNAKGLRVILPLTRASGTADNLKKLQLRTPIVLIPDLRDVLLKRAKLTMPAKDSTRTPLKRISPETLRNRSETPISARRNADRACKTGSPASPATPDLVSSISPFANTDTRRPRATSVRSRSLRSRREYLRGSRDQSADSTASQSVQDIAFCKYCSKKFNISDFAVEHEHSCAKNPAIAVRRSGDFRNNAEEKVSFLQCLQLKPACEEETTSAGEAATVIEPGASDARRLRIERARVVKHFRTYPVPISSCRGQKLIAESGTVYHDHTLSPTMRLDDYCFSVKTRPRSNWPTIASKKKNAQEQNYAHQATFTRQQRILRNSEIVVGVSQKSWKYLNKCKPARINVTRLTDEEIKKYVTRRRDEGKDDLGRQLRVNLEDLTKQKWFLKRFPSFGNKNRIRR